MRLHSYPSIFAVGHRALVGLLDGPVIIEEKIDGSQITFGVIDGELCIRSKGAEIFADAPEKMFALGVEKIKGVTDKLVPGWHYRGEFLQKPKHNTLVYSRVPTNHIVIFDIDKDGIGDFADRATKEHAALVLGFDVIPELFRGRIESVEQLQQIIDRDSYLGGQKVEGVVIKPEKYDVFGKDKKVLMAKFVRADFQEMNSKEFRKTNPTKNDMIQLLGLALKTEARWRKVVQHLKERGAIEGSPKDIGALFKELHADIEKECADEIRERLYRWALPQIKRIAAAGLPEWYKGQLAQQQFTAEVPID